MSFGLLVLKSFLAFLKVYIACGLSNVVFVMRICDCVKERVRRVWGGGVRKAGRESVCVNER